MPKTKSFDINDKEDLVICEKMLKNYDLIFKKTILEKL